MPSSISASSTRLNESRTVSAPRPSGKNSVPGTMPTPCSTARCASSTESAPSGSVSQEKKPPCGSSPACPLGHRALERRQQALGLALVQRPRQRHLLVQPPAASGLLEEPLPERARALVGVLLGGDEPGGDVGGADRPAEPDPREHRLRCRARLDDDVRTEAPEARERVGRRSRARGTRRPRRSGTRTGARARPAAHAARRRGSRRPDSGGRGCCRGASGAVRRQAAAPARPPRARARPSGRRRASPRSSETPGSRPGTSGPSTTTTSPGSRYDLVTSSSASIPPLVISSSSSAGRRPCSRSSRSASASRGPASPRVGAYWNALTSPAAANSWSSAETRSRGNVFGSGKPPAKEIRSGMPSSARTEAIPSPTSPRVRAAASASHRPVSGVTVTPPILRRLSISGHPVRLTDEFLSARRVLTSEYSIRVVATGGEHRCRRRS